MLIGRLHTKGEQGPTKHYRDKEPLGSIRSWEIEAEVSQLPRVGLPSSLIADSSFSQTVSGGSSMGNSWRATSAMVSSSTRRAWQRAQVCTWGWAETSCPD